MAGKFITIGSKGMSISPNLTEIKPPLKIGTNHLRWAGNGASTEANNAHGWVSENNEPFEIYPLEQALREGKVQKFEEASWIVGGRRYYGDAYLPAAWAGGKLPMYVAVIGKGWPHGRIERELISPKNNGHLVGKLEILGLIRRTPLKYSKAPSVKWTREHILIALNLYFKLPFGQFTKSNPVIIETAARMGRGANSLAMKLCNFASLDPVHRARGIKGLEGASNQDRNMWKEFQANLSDLGPQSEQLLHDLFTKDETKEIDFLELNRIRILPPASPTEIEATVRVRRGQQFFRQSVLNAYGVRCCISGINIPRLLVASHIKPWSQFPEERLNPRNGLCLSSLHDAAFDAGLITLDDQLRVVLSKQLKKYFPQPALEQNFAPFEGQVIRLPDKIAEPDNQFLNFHRLEIFTN